MVDAECFLKHDARKGWICAEKGCSKLRYPWVLTVEGSDSKCWFGLVGIDLEMEKAAWEHEEVSRVEDGLEERVVRGGGDEADHEGPVDQEEDLGGTRVDVGRVEALGLVVDASDRQAQSVEAGEGIDGGEIDGGAEGSIEWRRPA